MDPEEILMDTEESMDKAIEYLNSEFTSVRTGKASPALVEGIDVHVHSYGTTSKLKQLALITTPEARMLVVQPFDPGTVHDIERALKESRLGINPSVDGKIIRLPIPELSGERRQEMVKMARQMAEEAKVRVRSARRDGMDKLKAAHIPEDDLKLFEKDVQKLTDEHVAVIDQHLSKKETDIMTV